MTHHTLTRLGDALAAVQLAAILALSLLVLAGCDADDDDGSAMVMQPTTPSDATTRPAATRPATRPGDEAAVSEAAPVYISIDGEPHEFPPAKLWVKRNGNRIRAQLFSDDPPEALKRDWSGDSFYFEMDIELPPPDESEEATTTAAAGGGGGGGGGRGEHDVSLQELRAGEWVFRRETSHRQDTQSGIFLGGSGHLQPVNVSVVFEPLDDRTVIVSLHGWFAEFDPAHPNELTPRREVRVQAVLPADAIQR